eukprot:TRINITY_DN4658_c6_g1_i1.p1 TRINITY_DN4658_c6_g1~~TRINITY_DN4658_c6_g1_i1.p1  ORF type:complete len:456 (+),score=88.55 TRINITY_DN4658_c6_g1_i1:102-1469(+)
MSLHKPIQRRDSYGNSATLIPAPTGHVLIEGKRQPQDLSIQGRQVQVRSREIDLLERRLRDQADEMTRLSRDLGEKNSDIAMLRRELELMKRQVQITSEEGMRKELSAITCEIEEKRKAVESLELAADANRAIADLGTERQQLQQQSAMWQQNYMEVKAELEHVRHQYDLQSKEQKSRMKSESTLRHDLSELRKQRDEFQAYSARATRLLANTEKDTEDFNQLIAQLRQEKEDLISENDSLRRDKSDLTNKMERDLQSIVKAADREHHALRQKIKKVQENEKKLTEQEFQTIAAAKQRISELEMQLADTENELYSARAATAEAKSTSLMRYLGERGALEKEMNSKISIMGEEVRSCNHLVRRILERFTTRVEPPPGLSDDKLVTLKQLLLLLQSHVANTIEDPPPTAPCLVAWQQRGTEILKTDPAVHTVTHSLDPKLYPHVSSITSQTTVTTSE